MYMTNKYNVVCIHMYVSMPWSTSSTSYGTRTHNIDMYIYMYRYMYKIKTELRKDKENYYTPPDPTQPSAYLHVEKHEKRTALLEARAPKTYVSILYSIHIIFLRASLANESIRLITRTLVGVRSGPNTSQKKYTRFLGWDDRGTCWWLVRRCKGPWRPRYV